MTNIKLSRKEKKGGFRFFLVILLVFFLVLNYFKLQPFHQIILKISGPILNVKEVIFKPFSGSFSYFVSKQKLYEENQNLKREVSNLKIEVLSNFILKNEYDDLLIHKNENQENIKLAKVILKPPFSGFDNLILGGNINGSEIGQKIYYQNVILGEIAEIEGKTVMVKLYSTPGFKSPAKLNDGNQYEVVGRGGGQYEMILPKDVEIKEGDPIIYPDNEIVLFGVINKITSTGDDLFKIVLFNIPIDFKDINYVLVGNPKDIDE